MLITGVGGGAAAPACRVFNFVRPPDDRRTARFYSTKSIYDRHECISTGLRSGKHLSAIRPRGNGCERNNLLTLIEKRAGGARGGGGADGPRRVNIEAPGGFQLLFADQTMPLAEIAPRRNLRPAVGAARRTCLTVLRPIPSGTCLVVAGARAPYHN